MSRHVLDHLGTLEAPVRADFVVSSDAASIERPFPRVRGARHGEPPDARTEQNTKRHPGFICFVARAPSVHGGGQLKRASLERNDCQPGSAGQPERQRCGGPGERRTPSRRAASCHGLPPGAGGAAGGVVSRMNCSIAATTAAASRGEAPEAMSSSWGLRFMRGPGYRAVPVLTLPVLDHYAVLSAVTARSTIDRVRDAFLRFTAMGDAAPRSICIARRTATFVPCRRGATAWPCSNGSPRSRAIQIAGCQPSAG